MKYLEMYIQEKSLIQMPLFFFKRTKQSYICHGWIDKGVKYKLECNCKLGIPGAFEQAIYNSCLRIWIKQGKAKKGIKTNYSEIARELGISGRDNNQRIKTAIGKLASAQYKLTGCFATVEEYKFTLFSAVETFTWKKGCSKKKYHFTLVLSEKARESVDSNYRILTSIWHRNISEGLTRRLYQYLEKKRCVTKEENIAINEKVICRWLPITDTNVTQRRKSLRKAAHALVKKGYIADYHFNREQKRWFFYYLKKEILTLETETNRAKVIDEMQLQYSQALEWLDSIRYFQKKRKAEIVALPIVILVEYYPGIRKEYERRKAIGEIPKPAWIYNAFMKKRKFFE